MVERYIKDGKVAVLISVEFGAGWSSWNPDYAEFLAMDKTLVESVLAEDFEKVEQLVKAHSEKIYTGGVGDLVVVWMDIGEDFEITEYDGYEYIHVIGSRAYLTA